MAGLCTILVLLLLVSISTTAEIDLYSKLLDIERILSAQGKRISELEGTVAYQGKRISELEGTVAYQEREITKLNDIIKVLQLSDKDVGTIPEKDGGNYSKDVNEIGSHLESNVPGKDHYKTQIDPKQTQKTRGELEILFYR